MEKMLVSGVASDKNTARIAVVGIKDEPGKAFELFSLMSKNNINVDIILQSIGRDGTKDISFTVPEDDADEALRIIEENQERLTAQRVECDKSVAKVSIVGAGMQTNVGVATLMFEALYDESINIHMISTSEIKITVLIDEKYTEDAMNAIHEAFKLSIK